MLGVGPGCYPATDIDLPAGSVLALYTDGLVEQPGQDVATGMSRLARALTADPVRSLNDLCDSVLASLDSRPRDDIALLLAVLPPRPLADPPQGWWAQVKAASVPSCSRASAISSPSSRSNYRPGSAFMSALQAASPPGACSWAGGREGCPVGRGLQGEPGVSLTRSAGQARGSCAG
jgi:Stage II sporulation protein E (SpoIIE)